MRAGASVNKGRHDGVTSVWLAAQVPFFVLFALADAIPGQMNSDKT